MLDYSFDRSSRLAPISKPRAGEAQPSAHGHTLDQDIEEYYSPMRSSSAYNTDSGSSTYTPPVRSFETLSPSRWAEPALSAGPHSDADRTTRSRDSDKSQFYILADILIPGRGCPLVNVAVGISGKDGTITYIGSQDSVRTKLEDGRSTRVHCLLPGLWDCHTHFAGILNVDFPDMILKNPAVYGAMNVRGFYDTVMAGFTSVRDVGSFAIETYEAVEAGLIIGPNVYGAGAAIGITGGSCDAVTLPLDFVNTRQGVSTSNNCPGCCTLQLADGIDESRKAVRQQIRRGARCIKVVATGGVLSTQDEPENRQFSDAELRVLVEEASLHGRAVACHAHGKAGIMAAIHAGAHTIEHGSYLDEEAAELMVRKGVTLVSTRYVIEAGLKQLDKLNPETAKKMVRVSNRHMEAYRIAVRKGVKIALGTDIASSDRANLTSHGRNGSELPLAIKAGLSPLGAIEAATINAAETLGRLTPKKGLIKVGWDADLIALDENPLENMDLFCDPANVKFVWMGGKMVKAHGKGIWP